MSERLHRQNLPQFHLRSEYDAKRGENLFEPAIQAFEDVISHRDGLAGYSAGIDVVRRQLSILYVNDIRATTDQGLSLSDAIEYQVRRQPLVVELDLKIEDYRRGLLKQLAQLSIKEFIDVSASPFLTEYHLELYEGGGTQALLTTNDVVGGLGYDSRPMSFYDFKGMLYRLEDTAEIVQQVAEAHENDKPGEVR